MTYPVLSMCDVAPVGAQTGAPINGGRLRLPRGHYMAAFAGMRGEVVTDKSGYTVLLQGNGGSMTLTAGQVGYWPGGLVEVVKLWCGAVADLDILIHRISDYREIGASI